MNFTKNISNIASRLKRHLGYTEPEVLKTNEAFNEQNPQYSSTILPIHPSARNDSSVSSSIPLTSSDVPAINYSDERDFVMKNPIYTLNDKKKKNLISSSQIEDANPSGIVFNGNIDDLLEVVNNYKEKRDKFVDTCTEIKDNAESNSSYSEENRNVINANIDEINNIVKTMDDAFFNLGSNSELMTNFRKKYPDAFIELNFFNKTQRRLRDVESFNIYSEQDYTKENGDGPLSLGGARFRAMKKKREKMRIKTMRKKCSRKNVYKK